MEIPFLYCRIKFVSSDELREFSPGENSLKKKETLLKMSGIGLKSLKELL